jgi:RND family efflux transporter MFP subunit
MRSLAITPPLLLLLGLGACRPGDDRARASAVRSIPVTVEAAVEAEVPEHRRFSGDVMPWETLPLSFKVGGRIARLLVEEGAAVEKGQLCALLDARDYRLQAELARTQVDALQPHLTRAEKLHREAAVPQAKLDELQGKMEAARIQQRQARAVLSYSALHAPMAGIVLQRRVAVGDLVDPSRPVAVLADLRRVKIVLPVPQRDLRLFRLGMKVELGVPGVERPRSAEVHQIGYAADPRTRTFPVTLSVENADLALRAGMIVETRVQVALHRGIPLPLDAVSRDLSGSSRVLVVASGGGADRAESRQVQLGPVLGERVLVLGGLRARERVVVRGMVQPGDLVLVVPRADAGAPAAPRAARSREGERAR